MITRYFSSLYSLRKSSQIHRLLPPLRIFGRSPVMGPFLTWKNPITSFSQAKSESAKGIGQEARPLIAVKLYLFAV